MRLAALVLLVALGAPPCTAGAAPSGNTATHVAPRTLVGLDLNLQIEKAEGPSVGSHPNQGVIVRRILPQGQWTSQGSGGPNHADSHGRSQWRRSGAHTLVETTGDAASLSYRFDTAQSGQWIWRLGGGQATLSGSFTTTPSAPTAQQQTAPASVAGLHVPLIILNASSATVPADRYPHAGLALLTHADNGTLTIQGFGPGTLSSTATYAYKRVSANTAVEEGVQTNPAFVYPYTTVYTFRTPTAGTWYQDFGDGLVRLSGTFDTFPAAPRPVSPAERGEPSRSP